MRRRIVTLAITAAVLALALFGVPLAVFMARYNWDDERTELERVATAAALSVANDLATPQLPIAPSGTDLGLYSPTGDLRIGVGPASADRVVRQASLGEVRAADVDRTIVVAVPIMDHGSVVGVVRGIRSQLAANVRTGVMWLAMTGLAVLALGVAWLLARRMAARLAQPLERLSAAAKALGDGDFTVRTEHSGVAEIDSVGTSLDSTAQRLGETLQRERAFSANASHQLRTPLAGLRLQLEAALEAPTDPRPAIRTGIEAADRLERTVNDLMTLTRDPKTGPAVDIATLLADLRETWAPQLAARGRTLDVSVDDAPRPDATEAAVRQVLHVLLDNAVTHGSGAVHVTAREAGDALAVDVTDEGAGITEGRQVFQHTTGHGIGLALARTLAEADGGRLIHASGATSTLLLPGLTDPVEGQP